MGQKNVSIMLRVVILVVFCSHGFSCEKTGGDVLTPGASKFDCSAMVQCEPERFGLGNGSGADHRTINGYPYVFRKTYTSTGDAYSLQTNTAANYGRHFDLSVTREGDRVTLTRAADSLQMLTALIDDCGRVLQSQFRTAPESQPGFSLRINFFYDGEGRLSQFTWGNDLHGVFKVTYDRYGNILSIADRDTTGLRFVYTYDYSQPTVKGVVYDEERGDAMIPLNLLEALGYLHLGPHHLRKSAESWTGNYRVERKEYTDHVLNSLGYVTSYHAYSSSNADHTYYTDWKCKK